MQQLKVISSHIFSGAKKLSSFLYLFLRRSSIDSKFREMDEAEMAVKHRLDLSRAGRGGGLRPQPSSPPPPRPPASECSTR